MQRLLGAALAAALLAPAARAEGLGLYVGGFLGGAAIRSEVVSLPFTTREDAVRVMRVANGDGSLGHAAVLVPRRTRIAAEALGAREDSGFVWGFRAGSFAPVRGRLHLGGEGELVFPQAAKVGVGFLGNRFSTWLATEGAGYLRLGWGVGDGTVVFARAGIAFPQQVIRLNGTLQRRVTPTPALGAGLEQRLLPQLGLRLDVTWLPAREDNRITSLRGTLGLSYLF